MGETRLRETSGIDTLPDIPPKRGGVLLVGINPAPVSVAAGHYYQGRLGQRLWARLERIGLLRDPQAGREDDAFAEAGHGLTDIVKRPTVSAAELSSQEFEGAVNALREKLRTWEPALILFAFKEPAKRLLGSSVSPGRLENIEGIPAFLLTGPYAPRAAVVENDAELATLLGTLGADGQ